MKQRRVILLFALLTMMFVIIAVALRLLIEQELKANGEMHEKNQLAESERLQLLSELQQLSLRDSVYRFANEKLGLDYQSTVPETLAISLSEKEKIMNQLESKMQ